MAGKKAVGLLSGGLDSILVLRLMLDQGIEVIVVNFSTPFLTETGGYSQLEQMCDQSRMELKRVDVGADYLEMLKNPQHGYGKGLNPCVDCRIFMLCRAKQIMEQLGAEFVFTGEVLGQRPMSQRRDTMRIVERDSELEGRLLRPLCAQLMKPTIPEQQGIVDREKLLAISGRSRKAQMRLAKQWGISQYPSPAGGCLLTDSEFARRLKDLFEHRQDSAGNIELLRLGRHFRLSQQAKLVCGRNAEENEKLSRLVSDENLKLGVKGGRSTLAVVIGSPEPSSIQTAARICARYSHQRELPQVEVEFRKMHGDEANAIVVQPMSDQELEQIRI
ncbi:MAG: hypothetical protein KAV99_05700 [Candidatus Latescibacteria bacterium]|nr:hypothetical protein [Candidatus Latescibacterota bacterium]